jgi:D-serine deaminase-like pyridoxal phosphate-dependent protein
MSGLNVHPGIDVYELDTPALLLDLDAFERNINKMAAFFKDSPVKLRPHSKTNKCPIIARKQIEAGAVGICCQKLGEAEVMVQGGIRDILICTEIVTPLKISRLVNLAKHADLKVVVDDIENVRNLSEAAGAKGIVLDVLIDINMGRNNRSGIDPGSSVIKFAQELVKHKGVRLRGLQGYEGYMMFVNPLEERKRECLEIMGRLMETKTFLERAGFNIEIVTGGGTGTYMITGRYPGVNEIQAGSYIVMDSKYATIEGVDFECALSILGTVISRPSKDRAVLDVGFKSASTDSGPPSFKSAPSLEYKSGGDELGRIVIKDPSLPLKAGDKLELWPSHCDTTINLHDNYYAIRKGKLEAVWPIAGRGKSA